jgi:predicted DNA-binding ribbon-helix-helix protein
MIAAPDGESIAAASPTHSNPFRGGLLAETPPPYRFRVTLPFRPRPLPSVSNGTTVVGHGTCGLGDRSASSSLRAQAAFREWVEDKKSKPRSAATRQQLSPRQQYEAAKGEHARAMELYEERQRRQREEANAEKKSLALMLSERLSSQAAEQHAEIVACRREGENLRRTLREERLRALDYQRDADRAAAEGFREERERAAASALSAAVELRRARRVEHEAMAVITHQRLEDHRLQIQRDRKLLESKLSKRYAEAEAERKERGALASALRKQCLVGLEQSRSDHEMRVCAAARSVRDSSAMKAVVAPSPLQDAPQDVRRHTATRSSSGPRGGHDNDILSVMRERMFAARNAMEAALMARQQAAEIVRAERRSRQRSSSSLR